MRDRPASGRCCCWGGWDCCCRRPLPAWGGGVMCLLGGALLRVPATGGGVTLLTPRRPAGKQHQGWLGEAAHCSLA